MKPKYLLLFLLFILLFSSCARHKPKVIFQSPFTEKALETWGYPLPQTSFKINSTFGEIRKKGNSSYPHQGIDISAEKGTPVLAIKEGKVIFAGKSGNYGLLVCIEHPGQWETRYAHLNSIAVKKGKKVKKGQVIGKVGATGNATGPHLHFELRKNGIVVNPSSLIFYKK